MKLIPLRDYVWLRPRPELLELTTTVKTTLDLASLSDREAAIVSRANSVGFLPAHALQAAMGGATSSPDALTFGEVLSVGPGHPALTGDRPGLTPGDLVGYKKNRVARELPDLERGQGVIQEVHEHGVVLRYPDGAGAMPEPLADWVITRQDERGARACLERQLPLSQEELMWGVSTGTRETPGAHAGKCKTCGQATPGKTRGSVVDSHVRLMIERVVASGPGRWVKAIWDERLFGPRTREVWVANETACDAMVGFLSCNDRARFRLHGETYTIAPWQDFCCCWLPEEVAEAAE